MRGRGISELLEAAAALPVGHDAAERGPLLSGGVDEVAMHLLAEGVDRELALLELGDGVDDRAGDALDQLIVVRVAVEAGPRIFLVLDSVQAGRDRRGEREVRVAVGTGYSRFDAQARWRMPDDPEATRPVVEAPGERGGGPRFELVSLVGVDRGREEPDQFTGVTHQTAEPAGEHRRAVIGVGVAPEDRVT